MTDGMTHYDVLFTIVKRENMINDTLELYERNISAYEKLICVSIIGTQYTPFYFPLDNSIIHPNYICEKTHINNKFILQQIADIVNGIKN